MKLVVVVVEVRTTIAYLIWSRFGLLYLFDYSIRFSAVLCIWKSKIYNPAESLARWIVASSLTFASTSLSSYETKCGAELFISQGNHAGEFEKNYIIHIFLMFWQVRAGRHLEYFVNVGHMVAWLHNADAQQRAVTSIRLTSLYGVSLICCCWWALRLCVCVCVCVSAQSLTLHCQHQPNWIHQTRFGENSLRFPCT